MTGRWACARTNWEAYASDTFFESGAGLVPLPDGYDERWIEKERREWKGREEV